MQINYTSNEMNQSIDRSINPSIHQTINQSINQNLLGMLIFLAMQDKNLKNVKNAQPNDLVKKRLLRGRQNVSIKN